MILDRMGFEQINEAVNSLDDICEACGYSIRTRQAYNPFNMTNGYTITAINYANLRKAVVTCLHPSVGVLGTNKEIYKKNITIFTGVDIWDYIIALYACALSSKDEGVINYLEAIFEKEFKDGDNVNDILENIEALVKRYTSPDLMDGELVAWLLEFKKQRFGFDDEEEELL